MTAQSNKTILYVVGAALAVVASSIERLATEIRHLQRTEVREVEESFRAGAQKGSSAMPHKRNPVKCEQLCGLARVLRANVVPGYTRSPIANASGIDPSP